ncbi:hypothetical protein Bca52824_052666 [Brassica carinata]|uniref:Uncharacterized protein n=1 Tax=Brassica carinata TaxID=52824 RepID=A0A8X7UL04_BRACI|nr:hypothetical protein Bca52824_052666 [Brassica carinata]
MELSSVKTERRRMAMVSLEALQSLSSGETRLSQVSAAVRRGFSQVEAGDACHTDGPDSYKCSNPSRLVARLGQAVRFQCLGLWAV